MNSVRSVKSIGVLALALLALCFNASRASAQEFRGKFTLSVETRWGAVTLPAGDYSLVLDHHNLDGKVLIRGDKQNAIVLPDMIEHQNFPDDSALFAVRSGGKLEVRSLYIKPLGLFLEYPAPKGAPRMVAQAPQLFQRVPIGAAGK